MMHLKIEELTIQKGVHAGLVLAYRVNNLYQEIHFLE